MKLLKKVCLLVMICAMMLGASSLLTACKSQSGMITTIETKQVVNDSSYVSRSIYTRLTNGHGLYYEEVDPSDRRSTDELPAQYTQIEYLESSGKQYIETGYTPNAQTQIEATVYIPSNFGELGDDFSYMNQYVFHSSRCYQGYSSASIGGGTANSSRTLTRNAVNSIFISSTKYQLYVNESLAYSREYSLTGFSNATSLRIFKGKHSTTDYDKYTYYSQMKLYSFKISEKDTDTDNVTYVRDFVPCVKDNICGLYDVVGKKFYGNADNNGSFNMHNDMLGSGTENDPYQISSIQDLLVFNGFANGNEYYVITQDIELNDGYFERNSDGTCTYHDGGDGILYNWSAPYVYFRKIDGQNHKIEKFYSTSTGLLSIWQYGRSPTASGATRSIDVSNIRLVDGYGNGFTQQGGNGGAALLVSCYRYKVNLTVSNNKVDCFIKTSSSNVLSVALIACFWSTGSIYINNCVSAGSIKTTTGAGGVATLERECHIDNCTNYATIESSYNCAAGVVYNRAGYISEAYSYLNNCKNYGNVTGATAAGGVGTSSYAECHNCYNYGNVRNTGTQDYMAKTAGGIIGANDNNTRAYRFVSCGNEGDITSSNYPAGILSTGTNSNNKGSYFENCYNKGNVSTTNSYASGISSVAFTARTCVNYGNISSSGGGSCGLFCKFEASKDDAHSFIDNCQNYGNVTDMSGRAYGIIGCVNAWNNVKTVYITNCINYGTIKARDGVAGILRDLEEPTTLSSNYYSNTQFLALRNCINKGTLFCNNISGILEGYSSSRQNTSYLIENCSNEGDMKSTSNTPNIFGIAKMNLTGTGAKMIIRNCMVRSSLSSTPSVQNSHLISKNTSANSTLIIKNCIVDCKIQGQQTRQFWGNDFSAFFVHRMTGRIGMKAFESVGSFMIPIPSASYLENDLNFTRVV